MFTAFAEMGNVTKCVVFCTLIICVTVAYCVANKPPGQTTVRAEHVNKLEHDVADLMRSDDTQNRRIKEQEAKISELRSAIVELEQKADWKPLPGPGGRRPIGSVGSVGSAPGVGSAPEPQPTLADPK